MVSIHTPRTFPLPWPLTSGISPLSRPHCLTPYKRVATLVEVHPYEGGIQRPCCHSLSAPRAAILFALNFIQCFLEAISPTGSSRGASYTSCSSSSPFARFTLSGTATTTPAAMPGVKHETYPERVGGSLLCHLDVCGSTSHDVQFCHRAPVHW